MSVRRRRAALAALVGVALAGSVGQVAWGDTFTVAPVFGIRLVQVGTNGDNADSGALVAVSHGGCTLGWVAVGVGNPSGCPPYWIFPPAANHGELVAVAVFGGSAQAPVAVSDSGSADGRCFVVLTILGCLPVTPFHGVAVSGAGPATGAVAVSGLNNASATEPGQLPGWDTHHINQPNVAVSGTGSATSSHVAVAGGDATTSHGGIASVSATGDAQGGSVTIDPLGQ